MPAPINPPSHLDYAAKPVPRPRKPAGWWGVVVALLLALLAGSALAIWVLRWWFAMFTGGLEMAPG